MPRRSAVKLLVGAWIVAQLLATASYVPVWRSELSLWRHASSVAPLKPRPAVNYAKALLFAGDLKASEAQLYRALALAGQSHLRSYDQLDAVDAVQANLRTVLLIRAVQAAE